MKRYLLTIWLLGVFGVGYAQKSQYTQILQNIKQYRSDWTLTDSNLYDQIMYQTLVDSVFPAWYGTPWDFNGISNTPGKGEIACGYFVSTTLKHAGFQLNRYKLAQQAAETIVKFVCGENNTVRYQGYDRVMAQFRGLQNSIFIVGLDYHVGFVVVQNGEAFFVHSDYIHGAVVREKLEDSEAFLSSQEYIVGQLIPNLDLTSKWLKGIEIYKYKRKI